MGTPSNPYADLYQQKLKEAGLDKGAGPGEQIQPSDATIVGGNEIGHALGGMALGAGRGLYSTVSALPVYAAEKMGIADPKKLAERQKMMMPTDPWQSFGKGVEQAGEFLVPGTQEEKLVSMIPKFRPLARAAVGALSAGGLNKLQGGDFTSGAILGGSGAGTGEVLNRVAPKLAEASLGIRAPQRAFEKTPGAAALELTRGVTPETILESGRKSAKDLVKYLESQVDAASSRPAPPIRGFLMPPREEIPLAPVPYPRNPRMRPMGFSAEVNPEEPMAPRSGNPMAPISEYPGINPHYLSGSEHPELSGRVPTRQGVLYRRPEMSGSIPPTIEANPSASMVPARNIISEAMGNAAREEASGLHGQLGKMMDFLRHGQVSGTPIPENITPRKLLDLKRGFSEEHLGWNPETRDKALQASRGAYHAMDKEIDRLVPGAAPTNQKLSSLIEVIRNADRESRQAGTIQKILGRFGAHTGALAGAGIGGTLGYREGGIPGAVTGAIGGAVVPELIASPEGQMGAARTFNKARMLKPIVGTASQFTRRDNQ